uniref:Uncharacterized protein n=1 Tax=Candidatus Kentrum sp. SD TaxID=2126332 RepID=A0A451BJJ5_9GAMM|nr:MAG: hypothetical protein BECKSD772D_GA0070982_101547 [Candidatus Kentron sp. SD]
MIYSEILEEKYRFQAKRAAESTSIRDYIERSHRRAEEFAKKYGFEIKYADLPGTPGVGARIEALKSENRERRESR